MVRSTTRESGASGGSRSGKQALSARSRALDCDAPALPDCRSATGRGRAVGVESRPAMRERDAVRPLAPDVPAAEAVAPPQPAFSPGGTAMILALQRSAGNAAVARALAAPRHYVARSDELSDEQVAAA